MVTRAQQTIILDRDEGHSFWMMGGLYNIKASSQSTGGAFCTIEMTIPPGPQSAPPPHRHECAEAVYVIEGTINYHIGDQVVQGIPGCFFCVPKGTLEWFETIGDTPARVLVTYTPGGMDKFFEETAEPATSASLPPSQEEPDIEKLTTIGRKYGVTFEPKARR